jgi:hypothetical protein
VPPKTPVRRFLPRKLLVAALGVATINYVGVVACGGATTEDTNGDGIKDNRPPTSGNLPAPDGSRFDRYVPPPTSGNLPAPPPIDAAADGDASDDGGDGGEEDGGDAG